MVSRWITICSCLVVQCRIASGCDNTVELIPGTSYQYFDSHDDYGVSPYASNTDLCWEISAYNNTSNYVTELTVEDFELETHGCSFDYLIVTTDGIEIGKYCGSNAFERLHFACDVQLRFVTDSTVERDGFRIGYEYIPVDNMVEDMCSYGATASPSTKSDDSSGLAPAAIAGISIGVLFAVAVLFLWFRRAKQKQHEEQEAAKRRNQNHETRQTNDTQHQEVPRSAQRNSSDSTPREANSTPQHQHQPRSMHSNSHPTTSQPHSSAQINTPKFATHKIKTTIPEENEDDTSSIDSHISSDSENSRTYSSDFENSSQNRTNPNSPELHRKSLIYVNSVSDTSNSEPIVRYPARLSPLNSGLAPVDAPDALHTPPSYDALPPPPSYDEVLCNHGLYNIPHEHS